MEVDVVSLITNQLPLIEDVVFAAVIILITWAIEHVVYRAIRQLGLSEDNNVPASSIFANIARVAIWIIGIAIALKTCFDYDVTGLVTALGVGGIALSLGLKDTLANLIGGLQVSLGRIVQPGQYIRVLSQEGCVHDISWRHTTIIDATGNEHLIPNSLINNNSLVDVGESADIHVPFLLPVGTDIAAFSDGACREVERALEGKLGPKGVRVAFVGEDELGSIKGNVVADILRAEAGAETATDIAFRALYPVLEGFHGDGEQAAEPGRSRL